MIRCCPRSGWTRCARPHWASDRSARIPDRRPRQRDDRTKNPSRVFVGPALVGSPAILHRAALPVGQRVRRAVLVGIGQQHQETRGHPGDPVQPGGDDATFSKMVMYVLARRAITVRIVIRTVENGRISSRAGGTGAIIRPQEPGVSNTAIVEPFDRTTMDVHWNRRGSFDANTPVLRCGPIGANAPCPICRYEGIAAACTPPHPRPNPKHANRSTHPRRNGSIIRCAVSIRGPDV